MERIKVAVSPFYGGEDWIDELTNITFSKNPRGLSVYSIPANLDLTNIRKAIRLNNLILVEDNVGDLNEVEEVIVEEPKKEAKEVSAKEVSKPEPKVETKDETPKAEAPKKRPAKKK